MVPQWWDNGGEFFDRATGTWHDVTTKNIVIAAAAGKVNSIPYVSEVCETQYPALIKITEWQWDYLDKIWDHYTPTRLPSVQRQYSQGYLQAFRGGPDRRQRLYCAHYTPYWIRSHTRICCLTQLYHYPR